MSRAIAEQPRILHAIPGRVRVHLPGWSEPGRGAIEARLLAEPGVRSVQANPLTGNVLILFDPHQTDAEAILAGLPALETGSAGGPDPESPPRSVIRGDRWTRPVGTPGPGFHQVPHKLGGGMARANRHTGLRVQADRQDPVPSGRSRARRAAATIGVGLVGGDLLLDLVGITLLVLEGSPLGLALGGGVAVHLLVQVALLRVAWRFGRRGSPELSSPRIAA